jgi:16S rRNA (uracil1498-N3)-methyltransferase
MSPLRAWIDEAPAEGARQVMLSSEESSHLVRSLRARRGDAIVLLDGRGLQAEGRLITADSAGAAVEILRLRRAEPLTPRITVAQGMPKGGTMDDLVRMACEAGAAAVVPLETSRCEVRLDAERARGKLQRWTQQAVEACKQCGNPWRTEIDEPRRFRDWLDALPPPAPGELRLTGSLEFDAEPLAHLDLTQAKKVLWLIGPEGDFDPSELKAAREAGFRAVVLGPTVLRAENAALACVVATHVLARK